jgi:ligand-binding sensor domain-containing protein
MSRYLLLLLVCALLSPLRARAQHKELQFLHFASGGRLSETTVSWITQDDKGFLWLATEDGMFRYDGYAFGHYLANATGRAACPTNLLLAVHTDRGGGVGASFNGLCRYNLNGDSFTRFAPDPRDDFGGQANVIQRSRRGPGGQPVARQLQRPGTRSIPLGRRALPHRPGGAGHPAASGAVAAHRRQNRLWAGTEDGLTASTRHPG